MNWYEVPRHLQVKYLHAAAITVAQLGRLLGELEQDIADREVLKLLVRRFHGLAAWAGLHGLAAVAVAAQRGEHDCSTLAGGEVMPEAGHLAQVRTLVGALRQEIYRQRTTGGISEEILWSSAPVREAAVAPPAAPTRRALAVGLRGIGRGHQGACQVDWHRLEALLLEQGFALQAVDTCREAGRVFADGLPDAVIAATDLPDGTGTLLTYYLRSLRRGDEPVVVLVSGAPKGPFGSGGWTVPAGGEALDALSGSARTAAGAAGAAGAATGGGQAGAGLAEATEPAEPAAAGECGGCDVDGTAAFPVDWAALAACLEGLLEKRRAAPRILYMESDDEQAADLHARLRGAGYRVRGCRDPRRFSREVLTSEPELVLMDLPSAGETTGDLVRWLKSDRRCATLPVIVLAADEDEMPAGIGAACAERLDRPPAIPSLLAAVAARIEHGRALKRLFAEPAA